MPNRNGTGPHGKGSGSGKGLGRCRKNGEINMEIKPEASTDKPDSKKGMCQGKGKHQRTRERKRTRKSDE
jgi:hypothetical protein